MQRFAASLLLSVVMLSNLAASEDSSLETAPRAVFNQLMMKMDNISSEVRQERSGYKTDNIVATQLLVLSSQMATLETQLQTTRDELQNTKDELKKSKLDHQDELQRMKADHRVTKSEIQLLKSRESNPGSSSFVHWGRKSCPGNTTLVYSGVAGGKHYKEKGSGTNRLCLSRQPEFDNNISPPNWVGRLYGAEYEHMVGHHEHDVPCSVCLAPESTTIMVPGTRTCPPTWTPQYHGHLISQHHGHFATEYVCLDQYPEDDSSGAVNHNGLLFYYTVTRCGSLPCPPYVNDKVVTCVVCSK